MLRHDRLAHVREDGDDLAEESRARIRWMSRTLTEVASIALRLAAVLIAWVALRSLS